MTRSDTPRPPALARGGIDRAADERDTPDLVDALRQRSDTRVVAVHGDRGTVTASGRHVHTVTVAEVGADVEWAFLGRDAEGRAVVLAAASAAATPPVAALPDDVQWAPLRSAGADLDAVDAGLLVEAVSLGRWLTGAPYCSACGGRTRVRAAGWARHCPDCGAEHFPRTDPAVIVAVSSADGERLLLGKNALWADRNMYSTFAGFVESGESLESAIVREVREEAGVEVVDCHYRGSQAWPYPRSLMLGFHARVAPGSVARPDGVEIVDARWFSRAELAAVLSGELDPAPFGLPGAASIAHRLIADWVERSP